MADPKRPVFAAVRPELDFPGDEARILGFWKDRGIFDKSLDSATRATGPSKGAFVFYEGPPTANGMPHNGHVLTRAVKDVFPRYKTMQGYDVPRKAGWDTHGLPVEVEVEKELRIHGKAEIEKYGVEPFTHRCIESVFRYTDAWEKLTEKIGFWVDLPSAYVTFHKSYVESVWWALSKLFEKGLLYQGDKVVWWWAQGGTALSSGEVGQGYKTVDDPSVFVAFPLVGDEETSLLVWTTTPWTLPSNMYAAVHPAFDYAFVRTEAGKKYVIAAELCESVGKKLGTTLTVERTVKGSELVGTKYLPPFDTFAEEARGHDVIHTVIAADFVLKDASGIVHIAPAFGEDDHKAHRALITKTRASLPLFCAVKPDGTFIEALPKYVGRFVKDCDKDIQAELAERGLLVHAEAYRHEYPFCWRADQDPLIQFARPAWYIRTTELIERAIENNQHVSWLPEHIQGGRFGDFLRNNVDWALSRERYWGTPLNVWVNDVSGKMEAPASVAAILAKNPRAFDHFEAAKKADPTLSEHLAVHKPWIDQVSWENPGEPGVYRRVPEVIDCWFDSGCMPFAQWGFPHAPGSKEAFAKAFPADFISEAIDQTRGWFYSLLMISTLVFDEATQRELGLEPRALPHPYKTCVVLGHVCDKEGKKESKSKGNYTPPEVILEKVRMEFAALASSEGLEPGVAYIAREDYEGLDLTGSSAKVVLYREGAEDRVGFELRPAPASLVLPGGKKKLPRRIVALSPADAAKLGLEPSEGALSVSPVEVPRLPSTQKLWIEDPTSPAPGADAFRWFFYASSPSWTNTRHSLTNVRLEQKEFQVKLRNVYSFFTIYANIDRFDPARGNAAASDVDGASLARSQGYRPVKERSELDRWVLSELSLAVTKLTEALDAYLLYDAAGALVELVEGVSNWWLRRSRARFWEKGSFEDGTASQDKADAYHTLYELLVTTARLAAPFTPFFAEELWQNLARGPWPTTLPESVHLVAWPTADASAVDRKLAREMRAVRDLVSLGLQVRNAAQIAVAQPLSRAEVVAGEADLVEAVRGHAELIAEELNVHELGVLAPGEEAGFVRYTLKPNFRALGPKLGKKVQVCKAVLAKSDAALLRAELARAGSIELDLDGDKVEIGPEELEIAVDASEGHAAAGGRAGVVVLHTMLDDQLRDEGLARKILRALQQLRKDSGLDFADRIALHLEGTERVLRVANDNRTLLMREALVSSLSIGGEARATEQLARPSTVDGEALALAIERVVSQ